MTDPAHKPTVKIPHGLVDGDGLAAGRGFVEGSWFVEEDANASRTAVRFERKLAEVRSPFQKIGVFESTFFGRFLVLDDIMMLTERDEFVYHEMMTHVPLCSLPEPESVLIIGGGDCGCLREVLKHPTVKRAVLCDIDAEVTRMARQWFSWPEAALTDPRTELVHADGVAYIRQDPSSFDLVIVDSTDPKGVAVNLFLQDFYRHVARGLKPGGVMVAQTESPHWGAARVAAIFGELQRSYEYIAPYLAWIPTYPSGIWSMAYASDHRRHDDFFDGERARTIEADCRYYNRDVQRGAFLLPTFVRQVVEGANPFEAFEQRHRAAGYGG